MISEVEKKKIATRQDITPHGKADSAISFAMSEYVLL